jgi:geranylgeranyl diphosphate synthase type II
MTQPLSGALPPYAAPLADIETCLRDTLAAADFPPALRDAAEYSLLAPGKRLRPLLAWHSCVACGGRGEWALPACASLELIHCFSLIHDDLPALDNDDIRRGRPTLHRHTSEALAILTGDVLIPLAIDLLAHHAVGSQQLALVKELTAATRAMIAGQVYDTIGGLATPDPLDQLELVHSLKTGALIRAACRMGALCAGGSGRSTFEAKREFEALSEYARILGLAFQVVDDLLDVTATTQELGKTAGKDRAQNKLTYPAVLGIEETRRQVALLEADALKALAIFGPAATPLADICTAMCARTK